MEKRDYVLKINNLLLKQAERLDQLTYNDNFFDKEIERAKALALTCCQVVQAETLILKREMIQSNTKIIEYRDEM